MAIKPITIFNAKLVAKEAERKKDFHSNLMKCLNMITIVLGCEISY